MLLISVVATTKRRSASVSMSPTSISVNFTHSCITCESVCSFACPFAKQASCAGLLSSRKAVATGSAASHVPSRDPNKPRTTHSSHSTWPLWSRSRASAHALSLSSGSCVDEPANSRFSPLISSWKLMRPSQSASSSKNSSRHGKTGSRSESCAAIAQEANADLCAIERCCKRNSNSTNCGIQAARLPQFKEPGVQHKSADGSTKVTQLCLSACSQVKRSVS
mmetsp:Transcript_54147/g.104676  ORF Transcript_54147/g.104676 Transcript_54147/m.104676 type:complete len:222 (+) Transcript_54147:90-755(+)